MANDPRESFEIPDWLRQPATPPEPEEEPALEPGEIPDWLRAMRPGAEPPPQEQPPEPPPPPPDEPLPEEMAEEEVADRLIDSLRDQAAIDLPKEAPKARKPKRRMSGGVSLAGSLTSLAPWQRMVLALLLFLNVLLLGLMCLVMAGRIVPF